MSGGLGSAIFFFGMLSDRLDPSAPTVDRADVALARVALAAAAVCASLGALALTGWVVGLPLLASFGESMIPMAPNTAVVFIAMTAASTVVRSRPSPAARGAVAACCAAALLVATGTIAQAALGRDLGVDRLVMDIPGRFGEVALGAMSPLTGTCFVLLVLAVLADAFAGPSTVVAGALALTCVMIAFGVALGYAYGAPFLYGSPTIPMALPTALAFASGSTALVTGRPDRWPLRAFRGPGVRARLLRALVPNTLGTLLGLGLVLELFVSKSNGHPAVLAAISAVMTAVVMGTVVTRVSRQIGASIERSETARRGADLSFRALIDALPEPVCVQRGGLIEYANRAAAECLGAADPSELAGRTFASLVVVADPARDDGGPRSERWRRLDGQEVVVECANAELVVAGEPAVVTVARDVTEQRRLAEQLRQSQKVELLGQLAGSIAHDFNNLLTVILSYTRFVLDDLPPEHASRGDLEEVLRAGELAAALTGQLLSFTRKQVVVPCDLDPGELVEKMDKMLQRLLGERVDLVVKRGSSTRVRADHGHVEQIVLNLAVNARDAMPEGGKLTIETADAELDGEHVRGRLRAPAGRYVVIAVTDTGSGMDDATQSRIFEPFFTTKPVGSGTGIGLATVHGIVKEHRGDLSVYSQPGKGTTFRVYLPVAEDRPRVGIASIDGAAVTGGSERILVVDDDAGARAAAVRALRGAGYDVEEAPNVARALDLLRDPDREIDLLVSDIVLPDGFGPALARSARELRPELSVLFVSGYSAGALAHQGLLELDAAYVPKPFMPRDLVRRVREVLDARQERMVGGRAPIRLPL